MNHPWVATHGKTIDFGRVLVGPNLNLLTFRGYSDLRKLAAISGADVQDPETNPTGTQRPLNDQHVKRAFDYASGAAGLPPETTPRLFTEVILNARNTELIELYDVEDPENTLELSSFGDAVEAGIFTVGLRVNIDEMEYPFPVNNPPISRVDGNHRLSSVDTNVDTPGDNPDTQGEVSDIPVAFCLLVGLDKEQEIRIFKDINANQKSMDTSHLQNIEIITEGEALKVNEKRRHIWLAAQLRKPGMAFENMIDVGGDKEGTLEKFGAPHPIRLSTFSSTLKQQVVKTNSFKVLYAEKPDEILNALNNYWSAVKEVFPDAWADKKNYILLRSIGLTGFALLGATLLDKGIENGDGSKDFFALTLRAVANVVDLSATAWEGMAGAGGGSKVANALITAANPQNVSLKAFEDSLRPGQEDPAAPLN